MPKSGRAKRHTRKESTELDLGYYLSCPNRISLARLYGNKDKLREIAKIAKGILLLDILSSGDFLFFLNFLQENRQLPLIEDLIKIYLSPKGAEKLKIISTADVRVLISQNKASFSYIIEIALADNGLMKLQAVINSDVIHLIIGNKISLQKMVAIYDSKNGSKIIAAIANPYVSIAISGGYEIDALITFYNKTSNSDFFKHFEELYTKAKQQAREEKNSDPVKAKKGRVKIHAPKDDNSKIERPNWQKKIQKEHTQTSKARQQSREEKAKDTVSPIDNKDNKLEVTCSGWREMMQNELDPFCGVRLDEGFSR